MIKPWSAIAIMSAGNSAAELLLLWVAVGWAVRTQNCRRSSATPAAHVLISHA